MWINCFPQNSHANSHGNNTGNLKPLLIIFDFEKLVVYKKVKSIVKKL